MNILTEELTGFFTNNTCLFESNKNCTKVCLAMKRLQNLLASDDK